MPKGKRKSKKNLPTPKTFKRGRSGIYYYRLRMDGRDQWKSTRTTDKDEANKIAKAAVNSKADATSLAKTVKHVGEIGRMISESMVAEVTGKKNTRIKIDHAHGIWESLTAEFNKLSKPSQSFYRAVFRKFSNWCQGRRDEKGKEKKAGEKKVKSSKDKQPDTENKGIIAYIDQVDQDKASKYSTFLRNSHITGKTYNEHIKHLSRVFHRLDLTYNLPYRDPFDKTLIRRVKKSEMDVQGHQALELEDMKAVISEAAKHGQDFLDLFILGSQTGMRFKDAALLSWDEIHNDFIEIVPEKTRRTANKARIPISKVLSEVIERRRKQNGSGTYVIPAIAEHYLKNIQYVIGKSKKIFEDALGKERTQAESGESRKLNTSILSFHSFRTSMMSLLASKNVSTRDAMRLMGWKSPNMIQIYERELEKARGDADARAQKLINSIPELDYEVPDAAVDNKLPMTKEILEELVSKYSNLTIGKIYGISNVAIKKWLVKFGIRRTKRIESANVSDKEITSIRENLRKG